jgi:hypothetical protein
MAEVCRHVFAGLPQKVWLCSDMTADPALRGLNDKLVSTFRRLLDDLSAQCLKPTPEATREVVNEVKGFVPTALTA